MGSLFCFSTILCKVKKRQTFPDVEASKMLSTTSLRMGLRLAITRNMATTTVLPAQAATDPIQQMFADKGKEYAKKKAAAGGKLPDATKETEAALAMELEKVAQAYGGGAGVDMSKFPDLKFVDPVVDDVPLK